MEHTKDALNTFGLELDKLTTELKNEFAAQQHTNSITDEAIRTFLEEKKDDIARRVEQLKSSTLSEDTQTKHRDDIATAVSGFHVQLEYLLKGIPDVDQADSSK